MAVFLFHGQEEFLMEKEIKKFKSELLDTSFMSMAYKVFDNPPFQTLLECIQSAPLMFGNTLSLISVEKYLVGNKLSLDDKQIESLDFALTNINPSVNIIFVCKIPRDEVKKPDSRKKLFKTLSKYSQVREFAQFRTYDDKLKDEIKKIAKEKELTISSDAILAMIEQLGVNLTLLNSEIEKLKVAIHPKKAIDIDSIKKYCTSSDDIFSLSDSIIAGNKDDVIKQYSLLSEKKHYLEIFAFLQTSFQKMLIIKSNEKKMTPEEIGTKIKMHPFLVKKTQEKLRKTSLERLIQIRENLINIEYKIKTGQTAAPEAAIEMVLLS